MGFGSGYHSRSDHGGRRHNNSQVAHVWNAQSDSRGQSNNGNVYFDGPALYSYGSHFLTGYIMPDGVALLNGDSYSVSTSGHQSDARSAVSNRATFTIAGLTELAPMLRAISAGNRSASRKAEARQLIRTHAEALAAAFRLESGESMYYLAEEEDDSGSRVRRRDPAERETAGAYLTRLAGLPAASWPKLQREAAKAKAKREAEQAKRNRESGLGRARTMADMTESEFRRRLAVIEPDKVSTYQGEAEQRLKRLALELLRALKLANAEGFSKRRVAMLKARRKLVAARLAVVSELERIVFARRQLRSDVALIRALAAQWRGVDDMPADYWRLRSLQDGAKALERLSDSPAFPFVTRRRLKTQAIKLEKTAERLMEEHGRLAEERRERERQLQALKLEEYRAEWLAGTAPQGGRRFDAESGGAALRIKGDMLQTSHGAEVPLEHAIRAFRFIKLCREAGREWSANGQQIRVGHFRVDSISAAGDMIAGCHAFTWPEVERVARLAGVFELPADDSAIIRKDAA
jgi:hypothetical protein